MTTAELIDDIVRAGAVLKLNGENVKCWLPKDIAHLANELRERKPELVGLLQHRGGWVASFPRCPHCKSYYLHRENNVGNFECVSCGRENIEEQTARRIQ